MGRTKGTNSPCLIPIRFERAVKQPMKHSIGTHSAHPYSHSPPSLTSIRKTYPGRHADRALDAINYKQPFARSSHVSETSYMPPRGSNRHHNDFGPFGTTNQNERSFNCQTSNNTETADMNSVFRRTEYNNIMMPRSDRLAGSYRIIEAARSTNPIKGNDYGVNKTWDSDNIKDTGNPLMRSQLPPPNQTPVCNGGMHSEPSSSRRSLNRSEDLDRILAKYGKTSRSSVVNTNKDPAEFPSLVRTDTQFRVTADKLCKSGPGIHSFWDGQRGQQQQQQQERSDILSKLNNAIKGHSASVENVSERTVQLPGPDGPVTAPMHPREKEMEEYQGAPSSNLQTVQSRQDSKTAPLLKRSTHVFPFKETPSGHLVIDPVQIAFESRKISVLVSDPNNNTAFMEFTTTKGGANGLLFQPTGSFTNKNERILHEVKKAMSIQETNDNTATGNNANLKIPPPRQHAEVNQKLYSNSKKATAEFEENLLSRIISAKNADTHVIIGDKIFPCHSMALELFSTYFDRLTRPVETIQRIQLSETDVTATAFPILMNWIVQSEEGRKDIITKENLVSVFTASRHLGMKDLEFQCITFLDRKVDSSDPDLMVMWDDVKRKQSSCPELVKIIAGKMSSNYHDIYRSKRFLQMEVDELFMLLNSDDISIDSEMDVYDSAVTWLLNDWKNRKVHTNKIMSSVRFGLLSPLQLTQINLCPEINKVKNEKDYNQIIAYGTVKSMIDEGLAFSILDESYKNQPEELNKWVNKTGVKAPSQRTCLVNRRRGNQLILEKISLLEDASQTKLRASFNKTSEKSSSYTLLDAVPKPGMPSVGPTPGNGSVNSSMASSEGDCNITSKEKRGRSRIPKPPIGSVNSSSFTDQVGESSINSSIDDSPLYSTQGFSVPVHEISRPKLLSNSSNTLQQDRSELLMDCIPQETSPYSKREFYDKFKPIK